jgi:predicted aspartyl protease
MMKRLVLAWLALACCTATRARAEECAAPRLENTVPMEAAGPSGEVVVPVTVNGVEKKFLFDTGGGAMNYIKPAVALSLGLFKTDNFPAMDLAGNKSYKIAGARSVTFGAITSHEVTLFQMAPELAFDGILSAGTMTGSDLDIDFGAMRLNFFSADHCAGDVVTWPHQALAVVPVTLAGGHFEIGVTLDGHALTAAVDTGSPWTILDMGWAKENLGFSPDTGAPSAGIPKDRPGEQIYFRRYAALAFPGISVANPLVVVRPVQFGDGSGRAGRAPDLIIGMEVLRHLHLYYAAGEQKFYITPAAAGSRAPTLSASHGHAWPQDEEAYSKVWDPIHRMH